MRQAFRAFINKYTSARGTCPLQKPLSCISLNILRYEVHINCKHTKRMRVFVCMLLLLCYCFSTCKHTSNIYISPIRDVFH